MHKGNERRLLLFDLVLCHVFLCFVHSVTPLHHMIVTHIVNLKSLNVLHVFGVLCVVGFNISFVQEFVPFSRLYIYFVFMNGK